MNWLTKQFNTVAYPDGTKIKSKINSNERVIERQCHSMPSFLVLNKAEKIEVGLSSKLLNRQHNALIILNVMKLLILLPMLVLCQQGFAQLDDQNIVKYSVFNYSSSISFGMVADGNLPATYFKIEPTINGIIIPDSISYDKVIVEISDFLYREDGKIVDVNYFVHKVPFGDPNWRKKVWIELYKKDGSQIPMNFVYRATFTFFWPKSYK